MRRPRRLALAVAAVGLALGAAGCGYLSPIQTHDFYQTADGTNLNLEQGGEPAIGTRNMIVVVADDGQATLFGTVANYTTEDATVELEGAADGQTAFAGRVSVPAGQTVQIGPDSGQHLVQIGKLDVKPGALMKLTVTAIGETGTVTLPVTNTELDYYKKADSSDGAKG